MEKFIKTVGVVALVFALSCYRMFVVTKIWALTLVPYGVPQITFVQAIAVHFALAAFTIGSDYKKNDETDMVSHIVISFLSSFLLLTLLWGIVALFY